MTSGYHSLSYIHNGWPGTVIIDLPQYTAVALYFGGVALNDIHWYGIRGGMQVLIVTIYELKEAVSVSRY